MIQHLFPDAPSQHAREVDFLFASLVAFAGLLTLIMGFLIIRYLIRFRVGTTHSRSGRESHDFRLDLIWTGTAVVIALVLFGWSARLYIDRNRPPPDALQITAIGKQWMWKMQHPDGQREINSLHIPVDRPIEIELASEDVIHSFYVPSFRIKQDAVPGRATRMWFTPTRTGTYSLFCAEYCGLEHSGMRGEIVVMEPQEYAAWLDAQPQGETLIRRGERLFTALGCSGCHEGDGPIEAPNLGGLFMRPVGLTDGRVVIADRDYIRDSILRPERDIVAGFRPVMPSYGGLLDDPETMALVAYIESLAEDAP